MSAAEELVLGVDLGGTKIEAVIARRTRGSGGAIALEERARRRTPTNADRGYEAVLEATLDFVRTVARDAGLDPSAAPLAIGAPGGVTRAGLVKNSNATCLNGRPFRADLERALGRSIRFENDANCFALAETILGAAREHASGVVFGVILGTGVGGGLVVRGEVWPGAQGIAGEWGHQQIVSMRGRACYCRQRGCLERYVAGPAIEDDFFARAGERLAVAEIAARRLDDAHAGAAIEGCLDAFARGLANVIDIVDPSAIVLGGGVSNLDVLYDEGVERVRACVFNDELTTPILKHALGDSAGVLGAALIAT